MTRNEPTDVMIPQIENSMEAGMSSTYRIRAMREMSIHMSNIQYNTYMPHNHANSQIHGYSQQCHDSCSSLFWNHIGFQ